MLGNLIPSYEVGYRLLKTSIDRKLDHVRDLYGEPRKAVVREIERRLMAPTRFQEGRALRGVQRGRLRVQPRGYARDMDTVRRALAVVCATAPERRRGGFDREVGENIADVWSTQVHAKDWRKDVGDGCDGSCVDVESELLGGGVGEGHGSRVESTRRASESGCVEGACAGDERRLDLIRRLIIGRRITIGIVSILTMFVLINISSQFR